MTDRGRSRDHSRDAGIRKTAIVLGLIALTFYVGFILVGVLQS